MVLAAGNRAVQHEQPGRLRDLALVGPTAAGKTALAAALADHVSGVELVSVDAFAVYRKMDIGTAKPTRPGDPASRHPWHLVDLADPSSEYSVADFQLAAAEAVSRIHERDHAALYVGGTGLYQRAVVDRLELPGRFPAVRARLEAEAAAGAAGSADLHARLAVLDPVAARRMEPGNLRRVIRALEVTEGSGRRFSEFGPGLGAYPATDVVMVGLTLERGLLDERLDRRLAAQMAEGLVEEVRWLASLPGGLSRTARQAIGYREILALLAGEATFEEAVEETRRRLRQFARRQQAWFRRDPRVEWFDADAGDVAERVAERWETASR